MKHNEQGRLAISRAPLGHIAATALAVGGLSAALFGASTAGAVTNHATKSVVISTSKNKTLGTLLVSGTTLYTLKASKTACSTQCLKIWPAVVLPKGVTKPTAGSGVSEAKLGTVERSNGSLQVTYGGKALYWFSGDTAAGQVHGNVTDTWGKWSDVVTVKPTTSSSGSGSTSNSGTGGVAF